MELTLSFQDYFLRRNRNLVTIEDFVDYLSSFQKIINILAQEKHPSIKLEDFRFLIKEFERGSVDCIIEPYYLSTDLMGVNPIESLIDAFSEISDLIDKADDENTFNQLKQEIKNTERRKSLYKNFEKIIPKENNAFQIYKGKGITPETPRIFSSKDRYRKRIAVWREMDKKPKKETFIGIIKNLNAYHETRKHIKIVGLNGEKIKYYYKKEETEKFINLYDRAIIKIEGVYNQYTKTLEELMKIKEIDSQELAELKDITFSRPLILKLTYDLGVIYGSNEEFDLYVFGSYYNEMLEKLNGLILDTLDLFTKSLNFTESSLEYRNKFINNFKLKRKKSKQID